MSAAAIVLTVLGLLAARKHIVSGRGLDKIVALANLCFAAPLAVFGAEHFAEHNGIVQGVPAYMPWRMFWVYFVGVALLAASLSIATRIQVRWSGLFFGIMMFLFVAMMDLPGTVATHFSRISVTLLLRELLFGGAGWILAGSAMGERGKGFITVGRMILGIAAIFYAVEHFLHPLGLPGVPLEKQIPAWIPARALIDYVTGVFLLVGGSAILLNKHTRTAATYLGSWILLTVIVIYGLVLIGALSNPSPAVQIEGLNYFFDTLLFSGAILGLASATPRSNSPERRTTTSSESLETPVA